MDHNNSNWCCHIKNNSNLLKSGPPTRLSGKNFVLFWEDHVLKVSGGGGGSQKKKKIPLHITKAAEGHRRHQSLKQWCWAAMCRGCLSKDIALLRSWVAWHANVICGTQCHVEVSVVSTAVLLRHGWRQRTAGWTRPLRPWWSATEEILNQQVASGSHKSSDCMCTQ